MNDGNNNINIQKDTAVSTWLTWKLVSLNKSFLPDTYLQQFRDLKLWSSLFEILGISGFDSSTKFGFDSVWKILQAQGLELNYDTLAQDLESGNFDVIRDALIRLLLKYSESSTIESQVIEIACEPPYNLPRSELTSFVTCDLITTGKALCALVHSKAMVFNFKEATSKSSVDLISFVLDLAEKKLDIPRFFKAEDLDNKSLDALPLFLFISSVLRHKGLSGLPFPSGSRLSGVSVLAGGAALKKFQDRNLQAEIKQLKEQMEQLKQQHEQEITATKASLTENLKKVEKAHLEETRAVKKKMEEVAIARDAELKEARAQVAANQEELNKIAMDKAQCKEKLDQYSNQMDDVQARLQQAIDKKRRERAKGVESEYQGTINLVRNNYQHIQKKLKRIEALKEALLDKSKSLQQQRAEYAARSTELQDLTNFITQRINFLVNQLEEEKKQQNNLQDTVSITQMQMQTRSREELKLLRQQEEDLRRLKQRMDSEQKKIEAAEKSAEVLFMEDDYENEKTKGDDVERDFDRADKESLQSELDGYLARRQICMASLEMVKIQEAEIDRSHKEVLSELEELDREERKMKLQLEVKPPMEKVAPEMGSLVMLDDEISIVKMQEANLAYDLQELDSELEQLKVEKWNVKTHLGQVIAQLIVLEKDTQVLRDMDVVPPSTLKIMVADVVEKSDTISHEKSRLKQWRNYYFGKYNKTTSQLQASGRQDILDEEAAEAKDEDMEDEEIPDTASVASNSSGSMLDSKSSLNERSSPGTSRKEKRGSWNFTLRGSKDKFSQSNDGKLAPPGADERKSKRMSITAAFSSLVPKIFS